MEKKRSVGVTVFGIIFILLGGISWLIHLFGIIIGTIKHGLIHIYPNMTIEEVIVSFIIMGMFLIMLIAGIGILLLKSWSRKLVLFILPIFIFLTCFSCAYAITHIVDYDLAGKPYFAKPSFQRILLHIDQFIYVIISSLIFYLPVFWFFIRPKVKEQFKKEETPNA